MRLYLLVLCFMLIIPIALAQVSLGFSPPPKVLSVVLKTGTMSGQEVVNCEALISEGSWPKYAWKVNGVKMEIYEPVLSEDGLNEADEIECIAIAQNDNGETSQGTKKKLSEIRGFNSPLTGYVIKNIQDSRGGINWFPILVIILIGITAINGVLYLRRKKN